jgi:hypothetical protein
MLTRIRRGPEAILPPNPEGLSPGGNPKRLRGRLALALPFLGFALPLLTFFPFPAHGQEAATPTGWEFTGIPALNYDSDEGFGYGAVLALYDYGPGGLLPYRTAFRPTFFFTTEGRRDLTLFFDAPHLVGGWRLDAFVGMEKQIATPYYGSGNNSTYDALLEEGADPYFYRFGRERRVFRANLQRPIGDLPIRVLLGGQLAHFEIDPTPKNEGGTLLLEELGPGVPIPGGHENSIRGGLVWDTRNKESGPEKGVWSEVLVERVDEALGSENSYTRWTFTDRRYFTVARGLVLANRIVLQNVTGDPPFYTLTYVQSSFEQTEALGGSKSVRGVFRNRYLGEGLFVWNLELRWRAWDFRVLGKPAHLAFIGFFDSGRVWEDGVDLSSLAANLHHGSGGGMRIGLGPNFVIATDLAGSEEVGMQTYIGMGYLF